MDFCLTLVVYLKYCLIFALYIFFCDLSIQTKFCETLQAIFVSCLRTDLEFSFKNIELESDLKLTYFILGSTV